jgi:hypothetical protein
MVRVSLKNSPVGQDFSYGNEKRSHLSAICQVTGYSHHPENLLLRMRITVEKEPYCQPSGNEIPWWYLPD